MENNTVQFLASLLDLDRRWTAHELAAEIWVCHKTVLHILDYLKLAASWIPHEISEVQQWHRCAVAQALLSGTKGKVMTFLDESSLWTKPGLAHLNQIWNAIKRMETSWFSLPKESAPYTVCCEGGDHWDVWYWRGKTVPRCNSEAGGIGIGIDFDICPWSYGPVSEPLFWLLILNPHWPCWSKKWK